MLVVSVARGFLLNLFVCFLKLETGRAAYAPVPGRQIIFSAFELLDWDPVTGVEDEGTFEWDWGALMGILVANQRFNWEHCTCADTVMDVTASTVNRELLQQLFIHCRSNWGSPSLFSAILQWLWVAGQNEHSSCLIIRNCILLYHRTFKNQQKIMQKGSVSTLKSFSRHPFDHLRNNCICCFSSTQMFTWTTVTA